uniref:Uncharacterized protein n=1 Tax=Anguilla anguilla TaxID=7936 RepID=A0A0E9STQ8_ANGAN
MGMVIPVQLLQYYSNVAELQKDQGNGLN